ncbi:MAG: hypothetical protein JXN64_01535 [Spirochaetes bacterium]|nr:hypothetical protein [Spirochaetota bacterium]
MKLNLIFIIAIGIIFFNHYALPRILNIRPFLSILSNTKTISHMGLALTVILFIASLFTLVINQNLLLQYQITYLRSIVFILSAAFLAYIVNVSIKKILPSVYKSYNIFLLYLMINCTELSMVIAVLNIESGYTADMSLAGTLVQGIAAGFAFTINLLLITGILDKLQFAEVHPKLKGVPLSLAAACVLALAFFGFSGIRI